MKLIIIQNYRGINNSFPSNGILKNFGHDLVELYETINNLESNDGTIVDDELSKWILRFLSEFAKTTRYYNLDTLTGRTQRRNLLKNGTISKKKFQKDTPKK